MKRLLLVGSVILVLASTTVAADLRFATVFSDHMVLQRGKPVPVWGWADPGEKVTVEFASQRHTATADDHGKWQVALQSLKTNAKPQVLTVSSEDPSRKAEVADVLVGEVWLGSGQSNMAMLVRNARDSAAEQAASDLPLIRMFTEKSGPSDTPNQDASGEWIICSPETVGGFSATLFFFGRELHRSLGVPVGLIVSAVGGTPIESWIDAEKQRTDPALASYVASLEDEARKVDPQLLSKRYEIALRKWEAAAAEARAKKAPVPRKPRNPNDTAARKGNIGGLFNGKISPLIPFAIRGAVWYQGEANSTPDRAPYYQYQLPLLITDWRSRWGEEFPFAWVQLPNFEGAGRDWPTVREGMLKTLSLPKTGMAITIDIGDKKDIHPKNKQDVGKRLAQWALGDVYGQPVLAKSGPIPAMHEVRSSKMVIHFKHADGGLRARDGELTGFLVAGEDNQWHQADAQIDGPSVVVSSPLVPRPVAVRYAWANDPVCNLVNAAGLPATPFQIVAEAR
ncbi:MAG: sialate O-acetylesterase [Planctomycetaceae bacterium]